MKKTMAILLLAVSCAMHAGAQEVTYNHDETKMNQVTVMETGSGTLKPALFYTAAHNSYQKSAARTNKLSFRTEASAARYTQVAMAETVDTCLTSRAEVEALNMADRQVDLAWQVEGPKIENALESYRKNTGRILQAGGTIEDRKVWEDYGHIFDTAVRSVRDAYMPNADRKRQYLAIYADIVEKNRLLVDYIVMLDNRRRMSEASRSTLDLPARNSDIAAEAAGRWKQMSSSRINE